MKLVPFIKQFVREEEGVTAIEYGLIAALIAVAIIGSASPSASCSTRSSFISARLRCWRAA